MLINDAVMSKSLVCASPSHLKQREALQIIEQHPQLAFCVFTSKQTKNE
jgi:hypothetical protein